MKKITIIGDFCYPNFAGGSSKHVFDLLTYFPEYDCNVRLLTRRRDSDSQYAADDPGAAGKYDALNEAISENFPEWDSLTRIPIFG